MSFQKATKKQLRLRLALIGPSGSGKTYTALQLATGLVGNTGKIAVVDTEHRSAEKFADEFNFDVDYLSEDCAPARFCEKIQEAEHAGYDCLIIDSLTHAWAGQGGALQMVDEAARKSKSNNTYFAWRDVTPEHLRLIDTMLKSTMHIIVTMRAKTEYVIDSVMGKQVPRKIGLAPIQRDGMEYEFDVVADIDLDHTLIINKTRCKAIDGKTYKRPDSNSEVIQQLRAWLDDGEAYTPIPATTEPTQTANQIDEQVARKVLIDDIVKVKRALSWTDTEAGVYAEQTIGRPVKGAPLADLQKLIESMRDLLRKSEQERADFEQTTTPETAAANAPKPKSKKD